MPKWLGRAFQTPKSNTTGTMTCVAFQLPSEKTKWLVRYAIIRFLLAMVTIKSSPRTGLSCFEARARGLLHLYMHQTPAITLKASVAHCRALQGTGMSSVTTGQVWSALPDMH